jgi:MoaA/NifB/PqqE/SkfB family radical SAM enzyme
MLPIQQRENRGWAIAPIRNVFLHVTKACNLRCEYCYFSARKPLPNEMSAAEFARLWPELTRIRPAKVVFTGGEPLLRPDIFDLLGGLKEADPQHNILRCLNSNGHLVTRALALRLVGLADEVRVSLDALRERNDSLRGRGNFEAAMQAIDTYYAVGFEPKVLITITTVSLPDLEQLLIVLFRKRITRIKFNLLRLIGRGGGHSEWMADPLSVAAILQRAWKRCHPDKPMDLEPPEVGVEPQCNCGVGQFLNIMPNGDVFPCHVLVDPAFRCGNIREESLVSICQRGGFLDRLKGLDFAQLADQHQGLTLLKTNKVCMGSVYAETKSLSVWNENILLTTGTEREIRIRCRDDSGVTSESSGRNPNTSSSLE